MTSSPTPTSAAASTGPAGPGDPSLAAAPATDTPSTDAALTRPERLDRLPFTRTHGRMLTGSGIGWALDAMDVGLMSFVIAALGVHWGISKEEGSMIASAGFVGMAIGASLGGLLADKFGRRHIFTVTLLVYGLATGAAALSAGVAMLIALRVVIGLGLGAELPVASTLMSEFAPKRIRGRVIVWLEAFWALGWILAAVIGTFVAAHGSNGWRWALAIGLIPALWAVVVRLTMPESVRYLESEGRIDEAEATTRRFEQAAGVPAPARTREVADAPDTPRPSIWSRRLRRRTIALWTVWFCINLSYYGAFTWIPTLLVDRGFDLTTSFTFTLIITLAQLPGYACSAWLIEKLGRRWTLTLFLAGSAISAACYGLAASEPTIIAAGCALSFSNLGAWGALYAIGPELYPTAVRGTGTGAAAGFGRVASIIAPFLVPLLIGVGGMGSTTGQVLTFSVFAAGFVVASVAAFTLPEKAGTALEE
jgi:putative MFS transporter